MLRRIWRLSARQAGRRAARLSLALFLAALPALPTVAPARAGDGTWTMVAVLPTTIWLNAIAVDPSNPDRLIMAGSPVADSTVQRVYTSTDRGKTWDQVSCETYYGAVSDLEFDPKDSRIIYATAATAMIQGDFGPPARSTACADFISKHGVGAGLREGDGLYRSVDGGNTWTRVLKGRASGVSVSPQNPAIVYATGDGWVFRSSDRGKTWKDISAGLPSFTTYNPPPKNLLPFAVHPSNPDVILVGVGTDLYRSSSGGASWRRVLKSGDEQSYTELADLAFTHSGSGAIVATDRNGLQLSADSGRTWTAARSGNGYGQLLVNPLDSAEVFAFSGNAVLRSTDGGRTFSPLGSSLGEHEGNGYSLALDRTNPQTLYLAAADGIMAYTFEPRAGALPMSGDPYAEVLPILAGLAAAFSLVGLRLRKHALG